MPIRHTRARHLLARHFIIVGAPATGAFTETIKAYLAKRTVRFRPLAEFQFKSGTKRYWGGEYELTSGGHTWTGLGNIASVEGLEQASGLESSLMTFTMSGVELPGADMSWLSLVTSEDRSEYVDRVVIVYLQFFDTEERSGDPKKDWQPLDDPYAVKAGIMTSVSVSRVRQKDGFLRTVSMQASNLFYGRSVARGAFYTDRDQQLRAPGDKGMQYIIALQNKEVPIPWR